MQDTWDKPARRSAMWWACLNGLLWALGNGLATSTLVIYLSLDLGAKGLAISLILAAPSLVGMLRLSAPALIGRVADRKAFCIAGYLASALFLAAVPWTAMSAPTPRQGLTLLVALWSIYHLLQYLATVALWSWLGDIAPRRIRGRFLGNRERWMLLGTLTAMLSSGLFTWLWRHQAWGAKTTAYAVSSTAGAVLMLTALWPLVRMPHRTALKAGTVFSWEQLTAPLGHPGFRMLLVFAAWFSFCNGLTQSAQYFYQARVLEFSLLASLAFRSMMTSGQFAISPWCGRLADRLGNRRVLVVSQLMVSAALAFFALATPVAPRWLVGAWVLWIAYAGLNVGLPNLMLKLSPRQSDAGWIAVYYAVGSLCYGGATILGGWLVDNKVDVLKSHLLPFATGYQLLFAAGCVLRAMGIVWLLLIDEPEV